MSGAALSSVGAVHGLVDGRRAAAMLGVEVNTFKVWASRSRTATAGIPAAMPQPVATMHGQIYRVEDIEEFGREIARMGRGPRTKERELGAYYTPDRAAMLMAEWTLRDESDVLLEPSLGEGQFAFAVQAAASSRGWGKVDVHACELDPETAAAAVANGAIAENRLHVGDFLAEIPLPRVDAVIGNPPYVRVRELSSQLRRNAVKTAVKTMGSEMDPAGSVWLPFVAKATAQLVNNGRLAMVLPLDFTYVRYARPLWSFLGQSFGRLRVLRFKQRVFPDIMQNILILLAEDKGQSTSKVELIAQERLDDLTGGTIGNGVAIPLSEIVSGDRAFQFALLSEETRATLTALHSFTVRSRERVKFNIGYVSGNKNFFHPSNADIKKYDLPARSLVPAIASSKQLSRQGLGTAEMIPVSHLWLPGHHLTKGERSYVEQGERAGIDMGYKCRIRTPWFKVPGVKVPDLLLTTFSDVPRLHRNNAGWVGSNSVLCGYMHSGENADDFVSSWYTPLTLLSSELEIHSLGGGVLVAVPREADAVQVLRTTATQKLDMERLSSALRSEARSAAYEVGTSSIERLVGKGGLSAIWAGAATLAEWRRA